MRILITGHKGFLGSQLYKKLQNKHEVHGFDCGTYQEFEVVFQDFKRRGGKHDIVLHCGAVSNSEDTSNKLWQLNYQASTQIADYCERTNTKLIFISSATAIEPETPYGWSKHCAEFYMRQKVAGMNLCILRPFNIWAFDEEGKANSSIVYKMLTRTLKQIYWRCTRDFIYISDVVEAVQQVIHDWVPGCFDIGTAEPTDIATLANHLYVDIPKPPVVAECPIKESLVARAEHLLPNWKAEPITKHLETVRQLKLYGYNKDKPVKEWHNTICTDWDGVWEIFPHSDPYIPEPVPGVHEGIQNLLDAGWYIEIYSGGSKNPERLAKMKQNLKDWFGQAFWNKYVQTGNHINFATGKPTAKIYLDDRGMKFNNWNSVTPEILDAFRAWWQHSSSRR